MITVAHGWVGRKILKTKVELKFCIIILGSSFTSVASIGFAVSIRIYEEK